jgi:hypothetical protein
MNKIISIKLFNGDYYLVGDTPNANFKSINEISKFAKLWFRVIDHSGEVVEVNGRFVMSIRYAKTL